MGAAEPLPGWELNLDLSGHRLSDFPHAVIYDGPIVASAPSSRTCCSSDSADPGIFAGSAANGLGRSLAAIHLVLPTRYGRTV